MVCAAHTCLIDFGLVLPAWLIDNEVTNPDSAVAEAACGNGTRVAATGSGRSGAAAAAAQTRPGQASRRAGAVGGS